MSRLFDWLAALLLVCLFGIVGSIELEDQQRAEAHRQETIAAARKEAALKARWDRLNAEARRLTSFDRIAAK